MKYWDNKINRLVKPIRVIINNLYIKEIDNSKVLEVGCGSSYCSRKMNTYGLDNDKKTIEWRNKGKFILGDVRNLPFKNNSFDLIWSAGLLEHFSSLDNIILEMKRVSKKIIAFIPNNLEPFSKYQKLLGDFQKIYSKPEIYSIFKKHFNNTKVRRFNIITTEVMAQ